jgi:hypothetical protein
MERLRGEYPRVTSRHTANMMLGEQLCDCLATNGDERLDGASFSVY